MGFFDFLLKAKTREDDKIYQSEAAKLAGLCKDVQESLGRGEPVLVGTFLADGLPDLSSRMGERGVKTRSADPRSLPMPSELWGSPEVLLCVWPQELRSFSKDAFGPCPVAAPKTLRLMAVEHNATAAHDRMLVEFAAALPGPATVRFYGSFDDPLLRAFGADKLRELMKRMGMSESDAIESPMVTRQVEAAQARLAQSRERGAP